MMMGKDSRKVPQSRSSITFIQTYENKHAYKYYTCLI